LPGDNAYPALAVKSAKTASAIAFKSGWGACTRLRKTSISDGLISTFVRGPA